MKPLEKAFHFYLAHQDELVQQYEGKYIVIMETEVLGAYDDELEAVRETVNHGYELGKFLVQKCEPELEIQVYQSRVRFNNAVV